MTFKRVIGFGDALHLEALAAPGGLNVAVDRIRTVVGATIGTRTYRYSRNLRATQELLGHADPATTAGYAAVGADDLASVVAALPAL